MILVLMGRVNRDRTQQLTHAPQNKATPRYQRARETAAIIYTLAEQDLKMGDFAALDR